MGVDQRFATFENLALSSEPKIVFGAIGKLALIPSTVSLPKPTARTRAMTRLTESDVSSNLELMSIGELLQFFTDGGDAEETVAFEEFEANALACANELARRCLERELQRREDALPEKFYRPEALGQDEGHFVREGRAGGTYHSLCGPLRIQRYRYRGWGESLVGIEICEGLIAKMTPALARSLAHGYANQPVRRFREDLVAAHRRPPSRATMERAAKKVSSLLLGDDLLQQIREKEILDNEVTGIVLGLDRTSVPMAEYKRNQPPIERKKPRVRKAPPPVAVNWRMDYVGTVSYVNKHGESLYKRSYRESYRSTGNAIADNMVRDVEQALKQNQALTIAIVQDGAPELWTLLRKRLKPIVPKPVEILDWYHASERLSDCLELCVSNTEKRREMRKRWQTNLLEKKDGAARFIRSLRRYLKKLRKSGDHDGETRLREHLNYFAKRRAQLCYLMATKRGLPIGSGVTEGTCKSLVAQRAKRSGQRWRPYGLGMALGVRALRQSDRFQAAWDNKPASCLVPCP